METGILDLAIASSKAGMLRVSSACLGAETWPDVYVDAQDLDGTHLDSKFDAADTAASAVPENFKLRMDAAFAYAVARDYKNATAASPLFFFGHQAQGRLRSLYCQATMTLDARAV